MKAEEVKALLVQLASAADTEDSDEWRQSWTALAGGLLDDGTVFDGAYAALPHLVEAAAALPPGRTVDFWVDLGCIVTAEDRSPVPADLEAGFSAALRAAEEAASVVMLWDLATGAPVSDGLPASTGTAGVPLITATTLPDGRTALVAGTRHGHRLRVWEPRTGTVEHITLDAPLTSMTTAGADLIVGGDGGVLSLQLARQ
ncbi:hypothetical protein [Streptomyces sp. NPDC005345]|uniref:hypothetical protein n=1 Tax=Streptomyces sp. NPDC005345 TaxID=3156877 RepID=UPI0033ABD16F